MKINNCGYDIIAEEYYDTFHKTCRNFDYTTAVALKNNPIEFTEKGLVLEVGCGRGRCNEFLGIEHNRIVQLDSSLKMLSLKDREDCLLKIHADATSVPLFDEQFSAIIGFLVDPFMGFNFIKEAYRLLKRNGLFFITTPAFKWGNSLRGEEERYIARFLEKGNRGCVDLPSILYKTKTLRKILKYSGFKKRVKISSHCLPKQVVESQISDDIKKVAEKVSGSLYKLPVVTFIETKK